MPTHVDVQIRRQAGPKQEAYWEAFKVPYQQGMNVITVLQEIQRNPVNADGETSTPVAWDCSCLEEVCGACTMVINGQVRQSCSALVDKLEQPILLEPMRKFPVVRDLVVDRSRMFESLKKVKAWVALDGTYDLGPAEKQSPKEQENLYAYARCMSCGCCVDACPQFTEENSFVGPAAIGQAYLFNNNKSGKFESEDRLNALMEEGGIHECGNAQNCVRVCPKDIPLTTAIASMNRGTMVQAVKNLFMK